MTSQPSTPHSPLVSILCRTINRPSLIDALASVNRQTWPTLELVLIDAAGKGLMTLPELRADITLKVVSPNKQLDRPAAANAALDHAAGDYLLFLDDDDWIADDHIAQLIQPLIGHSGIDVAYSQTCKTTEDGSLTQEVIAQDFDRALLRRGNYIPIHSALFSRRLLDKGCRFDEQFKIYEDWDFWLQCAEQTDFVLVPTMGAFYRSGGDSRVTLDRHTELYMAGHPVADARAQIFQKWRERWTGQDWNTLLGLIDKTEVIEQLHSDLSKAHQELHNRDAELETARLACAGQAEQLTDAHAELSELKLSFQKVVNETRLLQSAHQALIQTYQQEQEAWSRQSAELFKQQDALTRALREIEQDRTALRQQLESVSEQLQQLSEDYNAIAARLTDSEHSRASLQQTLASVQTQHAALQIETEALLARHRSVIADFEALQIAHRQLNLAHEKLDAGVREILNSFSWRVMAPYRYVRMRLNRLVSSAADAVTGKRQVNPIPVQDSVANATEVAESHRLLAGIVWPREERVPFTQPLTVQGWFWSSGLIAAAELLLDGKAVYILPTDSTPSALEDAQRIGFARQIDTDCLQPGFHTLTLRVTASDQTQTEATREFIWQNPEQIYQRWIHRQQSIERPAQPVNESPAEITVLLNCHQQQTDGLSATLACLARQTAKCQILLIGAPETQHNNLITLCTQLGLAADNIRLVDSLADAPVESDILLVPMQSGDLPGPDCLETLAQNCTNDTRLIYSDHDVTQADGSRVDPSFTFCWSPDLLLERNYIGGVFALRADQWPTEARAQVSLTNPAWQYQILLSSCLDLPFEQVVRIPSMLWSRTQNTDTNAQERAETESLATALTRAAPGSSIATDKSSGQRKVIWPLPSPPRVSIIIPTTGNLRFLKPCLDTLATTDYPDMEIIILDNSRGKFPEGIAYAHKAGAEVVECNEAFNWSRLNNKGVDASSGDVLLFLNDDIEVIHPEWLTEMTRLAVRPGVGTVGSLLLYPNGAIQHAGVFLVDHGGGARHLFHKQLPGAGIYQRLDTVVREVSANTGACLMITRDRFDNLGRFDESLSIVGNDIDLCLRCLEAGLRNLWTPHSRLVHLESVSRQNKPIGKDEQSMWARWGHRFSGGDPWFNPCLSLAREDMELADLEHLLHIPAAVQASFEPEPAPAQIAHALSEPLPRVFGVNLIAYIRASMGVGEASRGNAAALEASGIPFAIINYEKGNPSRMDNLRWQHKESRSADYAINLLHINADHTPGVISDLGDPVFADRYTIGFWAWEMPEFPDRWLDSFALVDEIWVPSTFVNQSVSAKSPVPVVTIPHIIAVDHNSASKYPRSWFGINENAFVFISMFDTHSIAQRKNPFGSIKAFQQAFTGDNPSVQLIIKINNADEASIKLLNEYCAGYQNIHLLHQHFDREQIDSLINCCDCFVSLHHSEGFGLGPAEAMAMGKVAMLTNWSGNTEYMRSDNCVPVRYSLQALGKDYGPYEAHQYWAVPDLGHAAAEMRDLASNPARVAVLGANGRRTIEQEFSPQAIGARMRQRLESIRRFTGNRLS